MCLAANAGRRWAPLQRLNALAGLGYTFTSSELKARLMRPVLLALLHYGLGHANASVLVQNPDDRAAVQSLGIAANRIFTIPGSGVDTDALTPLPEPAGVVTAAGRLFDDKGVRMLVKAHEILTRRGLPIRLLMPGPPIR